MPRVQGWLSRAGLVLALAAGVGLDRAGAAEPPVKVEGLVVGLGPSNQYKVGTWTPVRVQLKGGPAGFSGYLDLTAPDDSGTASLFRRAVSVGANETGWFTTYTRPGSRSAELLIQLRDSHERRVGGEVSSDSLPGGINDIDPRQVLLGTLGNTQGVEAIPSLSGFSSEAAGTQGNKTVEVMRVRVPDGIPARWYGYDALDALVIDGNSRDVLAAIEGGRAEALKRWVRSGGHLVLSVGANWQQVVDSALEPMLPARPAGRTQLDDLRTLESFAGSTKPITKGIQQVMVTKLQLIEGRHGRALDSATTPLVVSGPYGFGQVTLVALDVDQKPFATWDDRALFWAKTLNLHRSSEDRNSPSSGPANRAMYTTNVTDLSSLLHSSLEQFEGVTLVPFGWVAFFIFLYILLIGPGDYFFLKRVLKRMELTWITFPTIVVTVSLLAYLAAYKVKGTELRVNKIDAVDIDQETGQMRGMSWFTVFSPQNRDYDVAVTPRPVDDSNLRLVGQEGTSVDISWFGMPETVFGGMNNQGRLGLIGSSYAYGPMGAHQAPDNPESLRHVRVPIWSTKSFVGRWTSNARPVVESSLQVSGPDRLSGTVKNLMKKPLKNAILAFGKQVYFDLGTIEPGATLQVELKNSRTLVGYLDELNRSLPAETWNLPRAQLSRTGLVRAMMFHNSGGSRNNTLDSRQFHELDLTGQLLLDRPMLVADIDGAAADTFLGALSTPPHINQTTVLRVILPLQKP